MFPTSPKKCSHHILTLILFFMIFFTWTTLHAGSHVSGKFSSASGTNIVLNLTIRSPAPSALIVEKYFSNGNKVISTSPNARKIDTKSGSVKWLFKKANNGDYVLSTGLSSALKGTVYAIVRYREPNGGKMIEFRINP